MQPSTLQTLLIRLLVTLAFLAGIVVPATAQLFETRAKQAVLLDANTGTVLFAKNADGQVPPASLAKLMTMDRMMSFEFRNDRVLNF